MPYYRVLPPMLEETIAAVRTPGISKASDKPNSRSQIWMVPGLIACFACLTLGLFFFV